MSDSDRIPRWPEMGIEERTVQYSPSSMLDGPLDPYLDAYATRSAEARSSAQVQTFRYGSRSTNTVDVMLPPAHSRSELPLHVFIHGGYWQQLSKSESLFLAPACLAQGAGFAAVDYTLAPEATLDGIVDECVAAVEMLIRHGATGRLPVAPEKFTISGSSAGAHLTAMVAARLAAATAADQLYPAAVILVSGVYDLEPLVATSINEAVGLDIAAAHRNSPARLDLTAFPPTVMAWGANEPDEFKRQSRRFTDLILAAGGNVVEAEVSGRNHFDVVFDIVPDLTDLIPNPI